MKPTTEGSSAINFDIVCLSFGKDKQRGLKVIQGASKNSVFDEKMDLRVERGALNENDTLQSENGKVIYFKKGSFATLKENRNGRKIAKQIEIENR